MTTESSRNAAETVLAADVADRIDRLRAMNRARLDKEFSVYYTEGYEDALNDLHDALEGFCGRHFAIPLRPTETQREAS
jgi:hypothetical protein